MIISTSFHTYRTGSESNQVSWYMRFTASPKLNGGFNTLSLNSLMTVYTQLLLLKEVSTYSNILQWGHQYPDLGTIKPLSATSIVAGSIQLRHRLHLT